MKGYKGFDKDFKCKGTTLTRLRQEKILLLADWEKIQEQNQ